MYQPNQIVEVKGVHGRVIFHDPLTYTVHVLIKTGINSWKIEKVDHFFCKPAHVFLWTTESAFCTKHARKTPRLIPEYSGDDTDYIMEI